MAACLQPGYETSTEPTAAVTPPKPLLITKLLEQKKQVIFCQTINTFEIYGMSILRDVALKKQFSQVFSAHFWSFMQGYNSTENEGTEEIDQ